MPASTPGTPRRSTRQASNSFPEGTPPVRMSSRKKSESTPLKAEGPIPRDRKASLSLHLEDSPAKDKVSSTVITGKKLKEKIITPSELPSDVPDLRTRTVSQSSTIPMESDKEEDEDTAASQTSTIPKESDNEDDADTAPLKRSTRGKKSSVKSVGSDMDTSSLSVVNSSVSTVLMDSVDSSSKPTKSTVSSGLKDLHLVSPQTSAPGTPLRRSSRRRSSSGVSPMQQYDTLELRGRTVTETLSLQANFGQNKDVTSKSPKFDSLELRNRTVTETLSLTEDFGQQSKKDDSILEPEKIKLQTRGRTRSQADSSPAPLEEKMSTSPISSATLSTRKRRNSRSSVTGDDLLPSTPTKGRAMTPLKKEVFLLSQPLTPTRRSRRLSGSADLQELPLTPTRRSRRLSGSGMSDTESAPDGGLITGITPRATPSTPRSRRHTSVKAGDVEAALVLAGNISSLPPVLEEEETNQEMNIQPSIPATSKQDKLTEVSTENEVLEEEEDKSNTTDKINMKRYPTSPPSELSQPATKRRASRRVTITTLGSDVNLLTPSPEGGSKSSSRASLPTAGRKERKQKKYVAVKKKTSVRIK